MPSDEFPKSIEGAETSPGINRDAILAGLLNFDNPNAGKYRALIERAKRENQTGGEIGYGGASMDRGWIKVIEQAQKGEGNYANFGNFLEGKLKGKILVDLAGGVGNMRDFAKKAKAGVYILVERFYGNQEGDDPYKDVWDIPAWDKPGEMVTIVVRSDVLLFLSKLKSNSVNITVNGFDNFVQSSADYHKAVAEEITRVTESGGIAFGVQSDAFLYLNEEKMKGGYGDLPNSRLYVKS